MQRVISLPVHYPRGAFILLHQVPYDLTSHFLLQSNRQWHRTRQVLGGQDIRRWQSQELHHLICNLLPTIAAQRNMQRIGSGKLYSAGQSLLPRCSKSIWGQGSQYCTRTTWTFGIRWRLACRKTVCLGLNMSCPTYFEKEIRKNEKWIGEWEVKLQLWSKLWHW